MSTLCIRMQVNKIEHLVSDEGHRLVIDFNVPKRYTEGARAEVWAGRMVGLSGEVPAEGTLVIYRSE